LCKKQKKINKLKKKGIKTMANVRIEKAIVKGVSSPDTIQRIAEEKGLNPQEVFVRLTFETGGKEFVASNKLRFLGKKGYEQLVKVKSSGETVDITVDTEKEFFYLNNGTTVDDLFKTELPKRERPSLSSLINM
jgi:hypothetical protein